jgi:hypothetical protein
LPKEKILFLADETFEFFNCWPDSNSENVKKVIYKSIDIFENGEAEILLSGHTHEILRGKNAVKYLSSLLDDHEEFTKQVLQIIDNSPEGITINQIYSNLRTLKNNSTINTYLANEFPKMPPFLKTVITSFLIEKNIKSEGKIRKKSSFHRSCK